MLDSSSENEEWAVFFQKLGDIIKNLLLLDPFGNDLELKSECEEVLALIKKEDRAQERKYISLVNKLFNFFCANNIFGSSVLPLP